MDDMDGMCQAWDRRPRRSVWDQAGRWADDWPLLIALALAAAAYLYLQVWNPLVPPGAHPLRLDFLGWAGHANDFKHLYLGAWLLRLGQNPYDAGLMLALARDYGFSTVNPYVYLPFTAQVLMPLTALSPEGALRVWFFVNHGCVLGALALMATALGATARQRLAIAAALVALAAVWFPLTRTLTAGQLNAALLVLIVGFWRAQSAHRPALAGAALAFAALFKIIPAFLVLPLLLRRRWATLGWTAGWGLALLTPSLLWHGPGRYLEFLPSLRDMGYGRSVWAQFGARFYSDPFNLSINAFLHRALAENPVLTPWATLPPAVANIGALVAALLLIGAYIATVARAGSAGAADPSKPAGPPPPYQRITDLDLALAIPVMLLVPSLYWDHYALMLIPALILIARHDRRPATVAALAVAALLTGAPQGFFMTLPAPGWAMPLLYNMGLWGTLLALGAGARACWKKG